MPVKHKQAPLLCSTDGWPYVLADDQILNRTIQIFATSLLLSAMNSFADDKYNGEILMHASGSFEVRLEPQQDELAPAGRMTIYKEYSGSLVGTGTGQMISKRTEQGASVYSAIEEFKGSLDGKKGAFTLFHNGFMSSEKQELKVIIIEGSGSGELEGIQGELSIVQENGNHKYELIYSL